jgi:hypothetical protein
LTKFRNLGMDFRVRGRKRSSVPVSSPCKGLCQFTGRNSTLKNKLYGQFRGSRQQDISKKLFAGLFIIDTLSMKKPHKKKEYGNMAPTPFIETKANRQHDHRSLC